MIEYRFEIGDECIIIMGCGSSVGQVIDSKQGVFKLEHILVMNQ
jgi:hypothetical protein